MPEACQALDRLVSDVDSVDGVRLYFYDRDARAGLLSGRRSSRQNGFLMAETIKIAAIETGGTWGRLAHWLSAGFEAAGFEVELLKRGGEIPEIAHRLDSGEADLSVSTTFGARAGSLGKVPYDRKLKIKGIAEIQYPVHWFINMMRTDTELQSFEELVEKKPPLRLCLPSPDLLVSYPVKSIFRLFGIDPYRDIPRWGGEVITNFNAIPDLIATGRADGVFRENSPRRYDISNRAEMSYFQLTKRQVQTISEDLGIKTGQIPSGTYHNQREELRTLDAEGFTVLTRSDLADDLAYRMARAIDRFTPSHYIGSSTFYSPRFAVHTGAPLHEGAARYYREQGYSLPPG